MSSPRRRRSKDQHTPRTARGTLRQTTPGSLSDRIATLVRTTTQTAGHALPVAALTEAFHASPDAALQTDVQFRAMVFALYRRGILVRVSGRAGGSTYAHRDAALPAPPEPDDVTLTLRALEHAYAAAGRPVTTSEVTRSIGEMGAALHTEDINAVRVRLSTLSRTRRRADPEWYAPRVTRITETNMRGRPTCRWAPANAAAPSSLASDTFATESDAVRTLVATVEGMLGRPVSRRECAWYIEAHPETPCVRAIAKRPLGYLLTYTSGADKKVPVTPGAMVIVDTPESCWGGAPRRYRIAGASTNAAVADAALRVEDLALRFKVAHDQGTLEHIKKQPWMTKVVVARRNALASALAPLRSLSGEGLADAVALLDHGYDLQDAWITVTTLHADTAHARKRYVEFTRDSVQATAKAARVATLGAARAPDLGGVLIPTLQYLIDAAASELQDFPEAVRRACLRDVPRVPLTPTAQGFGVHTHRDRVGVDRVEAVLNIFRMIATPRTHALLSGAAGLLGTALRDRAPLQAVFAAPDAVVYSRRQAVVALALLGDTPTPAMEQRLMAGDIQDQRALALAYLASGNLAAIAQKASASPFWQQVALRVSTGHLLTAVE